MARKTVEDLEDNQFITTHNAAKTSKISQEKYSTVAISQTPVSSYAYVLSFPWSSDKNLTFYLTDMPKIALLTESQMLSANLKSFVKVFLLFSSSTFEGSETYL